MKVYYHPVGILFLSSGFLEFPSHPRRKNRDYLNVSSGDTDENEVLGAGCLGEDAERGLELGRRAVGREAPGLEARAR